MTDPKDALRVVALAGGVGGAKLAAGLEAVLPVGGLSVVVNTADDFDLWGLRICPDLDTVMYTLAGLANPETGWGVIDESFAALSMISAYGEDAWFKLGDKDLATHILRTERLRAGERLTTVTAGLSSALAVRSTILPMCDEPVSTLLKTHAGLFDFQEYFVRREQRDEVLGVDLRGIENARVPAEVLAAIYEAEAIIFCPSNPVVSIGPILAVPGMLETLSSASAPKVAVSPIVGGRALKGPADKMLRSLGHEVSAAGVARMYKSIVDGMAIDRVDEGEKDAIGSLRSWSLRSGESGVGRFAPGSRESGVGSRSLRSGESGVGSRESGKNGMRVLITETVMRDEAGRECLAREVLRFCSELM